MAVRTTVDIPETLHYRLRQKAESSGTSIRALIISAVEQVYAEGTKGEYVTGPLSTCAAKLARAFPDDENPP